MTRSALVFVKPGRGNNVVPLPSVAAAELEKESNQSFRGYLRFYRDGEGRTAASFSDAYQAARRHEKAITFIDRHGYEVPLQINHYLGEGGKRGEDVSASNPRMSPVPFLWRLTAAMLGLRLVRT